MIILNIVKYNDFLICMVRVFQGGLRLPRTVPVPKLLQDNLGHPNKSQRLDPVNPSPGSPKNSRIPFLTVPRTVETTWEIPGSSRG